MAMPQQERSPLENETNPRTDKSDDAQEENSQSSGHHDL